MLELSLRDIWSNGSDVCSKRSIVGRVFVYSNHFWKHFVVDAFQVKNIRAIRILNPKET